MGEVIAVAPEIQDQIRVGSIVVYSKHVGTNVKMGAEAYLILRLDDVLAIVE